MHGAPSGTSYGDHAPPPGKAVMEVVAVPGPASAGRGAGAAAELLVPPAGTGSGRRRRGLQGSRGAGAGTEAGAARPPLPAVWRTESGRLVDPEEEEEEGCRSPPCLLTDCFGVCPPPSRHPWGP